MKHKPAQKEEAVQPPHEPEHQETPAEQEVKDPVQELTQQLQRLQAEFDNYRRRVNAEATDAKERGKVEAVTELLPVVDALELALVHASNTDKEQSKEALVKGITAIHSQLHQILERLGVQQIPETGLVDPRHHEVYLTETTDKHPANSIIQTLQKGYIRNGTILRTAKVKAARAN